MSEKQPNRGVPDPLSSLCTPTPQERPEQLCTKSETESSSGSRTGGGVAWRTAKKMVLALLRQPIPETARKLARSEKGAGTQPMRSERMEDRNLDAEEDLVHRNGWATFLVCVCFSAAFCGGAGFLFIYWTGGGNEDLGGCLAVFFGALAIGLVSYEHLLVVHKEAREPRETMQPSAEERAATAEDFRAGELELQRRGMLKWMTAIGLGTAAAMFVSVLKSALPNPLLSLYTGVWKRGQRLMTGDGEPVKADQLPPGSTTIVFPEDSIGSEKAQTVLIRVNPQLLELPGDRADWAPLGNLAYSRICTHAGCPVGMYEKTAHLLMCPCHQSTFAVLRAAQPTGGPAARALPQLPLYVDADGILRAGGDFSSPPGPGFWGMPS
jgi:ubiquinol-cytochrome c reductase iron-sulfur subunit